MKKKFLLVFGVCLMASMMAVEFAKPEYCQGAAKPKEKAIVVSITNEPDFLDPYLTVAAGTREILFNIFEGLLKPDAKGNLVPALATGYQVSDDALKYTFTLRKNVKFHNGKTVTAEDVKYSLEKAAGKSGKPYQNVPALADIKSVVIKNATTIEIVMKKANADLLASLTVAIVPQGYNNQNKKPIGTGPFKFLAYLPQQQLVLVKNPDYWKKGLPHLDKVTFKLAADEDAAFIQLKAGHIDLEPYTTYEKAQQLTQNYHVLKGTYNLVQLLALNNARKPFNDLRVRQALCYAINTQNIINTVCYGEGRRIGSGFFPGFKKYYQPGLENTYPANIAKAKNLLRQAGYPNGFKTTITVPSNYKTHVDTAQVIVEQLKQINVIATIKQVEWGVWLDQVYAKRLYDTTVIALDASLLSPTSLLGRYKSTAPTNFINYKNSTYDKLLESAVRECDDAKQVKYFKQLQTILAKDAASVFIQDPPKTVLLRKNLAGYQFYPLYVLDLSTLYYTK